LCHVVAGRVDSGCIPPFDSSRLGFLKLRPGVRQPALATLLEHAVRRREGVLTDLGALSAFTGTRTGRSPKDKHTVKEPSVADQIDWTANQAMDQETFNKLRDRVEGTSLGPSPDSRSSRSGRRPKAPSPCGLSFATAGAGARERRERAEVGQHTFAAAHGVFE